MDITSVIAQLRTTDLNESIRFYTERIGLALEFRYEDFYAGIRADTQIFHLKLIDEKDPSIKFVDDGEHFHLYFGTDDIAALDPYLPVPVGLALGVEPGDQVGRVHGAARDEHRADAIEQDHIRAVSDLAGYGSAGPGMKGCAKQFPDLVGDSRSWSRARRRNGEVRVFSCCITSSFLFGMLVD